MKAKFKSVDQISPDILCCETVREYLCAHQDEVFEVDPRQKSVMPAGHYTCIGCGRLSPVLTVISEAPDCWIWVDTIDIDEGVN
jgi:hypothetical protein